MGTDADTVNVLRDLVQFLERLCQEVNLPDNLEDARESLLQRSRISLIAVDQRSTSPEPYLDMNAGKGKGLHLIKTITDNININDNQITEYIDTDNPKNKPRPTSSSSSSSSPDYYESYHQVTTNFSESTNTNDHDDTEEKLKMIYKTFTAEQTRSKCIKSGPLWQIEERKIFGFPLFGGLDSFRPCWIGLVGTHLISYSTKNDKQANEIISIRGYSARPSPDSVPRYPERCKSAFEIFCPGKKTYQFSARTPKEMEQWVATICRIGCVKNDYVFKASTIIGIDTLSTEEQYQDVATKDNCNGNDVVELRKPENVTLLTAPPLPARIPRRLPSLPHEDSVVTTTQGDDCYEEDDIYHKIEDLKEPNNYQNLPTDVKNNDKQAELETYDDACEMMRKEKSIKIKIKSNDHKDLSNAIDTYDDIHSVECSKSESIADNRTSIMYDDIEAATNSSKKHVKESPRKMSFLERVRYKKESPKKEDKKKIKQKNSSKDTVNQSQPEASQEQLLMYDDVSNLALNSSNMTMENMADYTCPPPPRPIYVKPPTIASVPVQEIEEYYDDIGSIRTEIDEKSRIDVLNSHESSCQVKDEQSVVVNNSSQTKCDVPLVTNDVNDDLEHYQVPRSQDPIDLRGQLDVATMEEELYDDIAILTDFRTRQRDSGCSTSSTEKNVMNVTKAWSRFASRRNFKICELSPAERSKRVNSDESVDSSLDFNDTADHMKLNKFQKLINKMELSLNKSTKTVPMVNKTHDES